MRVSVIPTAFLHVGARYDLVHAWCTNYDLKQGCCAGNELEADWRDTSPVHAFERHADNHMQLKIHRIPED